MKFFKTFSQKPAEIERKWYIIDAKEATLGRLASHIASVLTGKNKVTFTPHTDNGDYVIVVNAKDLKVTGDKMVSKKYYRHSGYIGNIKEKTLAELVEKTPEIVIIEAVKGMLPKNKLQADRIARLRVFAGEEHTHEAQTPIKLEIKKEVK